MAKIKILLEGFTNADSKIKSDKEKTQPTITLVQDKNINMVVDPGVMQNPQDLIAKLKQENLKPEDINFIFLTHSHIDHYKNLGLFPNARILEYFGIWHENTVDEWPEQFTPDIKIIKTPGHNYDSLTLLVKTKQGTIAICGDVFWKENEPKNDPYASDQQKLQQSRKKISTSADFIIPGHGKMFKTKK